MMNETKSQNVTRSRLTLILLVAVFAAPIIFAWIVTKNESLQPTKTKNYGELVHPARPLMDIIFTGIDGNAYPLEQMRRKWSLFYLVGNTCEEVCIESLVKMREARFAQSGEALRVSYYLIFTKLPDSTDFSSLLKEHPRLTILTVAEPQAASFVKQFKIDEQAEVLAAKRVYLIDPIGNLMMYYPQGFHRDGLLKDLKNILHWSQIG